MRLWSWRRKDTEIYKECSVQKHIKFTSNWKCCILEKNGKGKIIFWGERILSSTGGLSGMRRPELSIFFSGSENQQALLQWYFWIFQAAPTFMHQPMNPRYWFISPIKAPWRCPYMSRLRRPICSSRFSAWLINKCPCNFAQLVSHSSHRLNRKKIHIPFWCTSEGARHLIRWYWSQPASPPEVYANDLPH